MFIRNQELFPVDSFKDNLMENGMVIMGLCEFSWSYFIIVSTGAMALIGIAIYLGEKEG